MSDSGRSGPALVGVNTNQVIPLARTPITIGRQAGQDISLSDPKVSRRHAIISFRDGTYVVEDLGTTNGTYVNGERIEGWQLLNHGDQLRVGNSVFDVNLVQKNVDGEPAAAGLAPTVPTQEPESSPSRGKTLRPLVMAVLLVFFLIACLSISSFLLSRYLGGGEPTVTIRSPISGANVTAGSQLTLQAMAAGARNISRLELRVDDTLVAVATSNDPKGMASLTLSQPWTFGQDGPHVVSAVAHTASGKASAPASAEVTVVDPVSQVTPSLTPRLSPSPPAPTASPTDTQIPTETPSPMPSSTPTPSPTETPTLTSTPLPSKTPRPTVTPSPTSTPTETPHPVPFIEYFRADPDQIAEDACTTLAWGAVLGAWEAIIDQGIGGVGTPGSQEVCPEETITYILTATGPGGVVTDTVTITVGGALPDLQVESISFDPPNLVQNQEHKVTITIRNAGRTSSGPFNMEWLPGTGTPAGHRVTGLERRKARKVVMTWRPSSGDDDLPLVVRVDTDDEVSESNERNNEMQVNVAVAESELGDLELQGFYLHFDGQVVFSLSNPGGGITHPSFDYEVYQDDELVEAKSASTPAIGSGAFWSDYLVSGEYAVRVVIDPENLIPESDESNNEMTLACSSILLSCK